MNRSSGRNTETGFAGTRHRPQPQLLQQERTCQQGQLSLVLSGLLSIAITSMLSIDARCG